MIKNKEGKYLICKMPGGRGVFPGQWALPGGAIEAEETMEAALRREVREEVGLEPSKIEPWYFRDDVRTKVKPGKEPVEVYMIYLMFKCGVADDAVKLNEEFEEFAWVSVGEAMEYDLNEPTKGTFERLISESTKS